MKIESMIMNHLVGKGTLIAAGILVNWRSADQT